MKKVLHLLPSNKFSGAENVVCTIIQNDKEYDMYYCSPRGDIEKSLDERGIKYIPIEKFKPSYLKKICKEYGIDIIHAHDYKASLLAAFSGFKGKIISHLHTNWDFNTSWNIYTILYNCIIKKFDKIIAVAPAILEEAVYAKKNKDKFVVIDNVIDKKRVLEKSRGFVTDAYDLIYVGRLCEVKRPLTMIEIIKKVKKVKPNIKMAIIGAGDMEDECLDLIKKYDLTDNIEMLGFKSNPFPYIKNSKIALLTSKHEGLPMVVIEEMILNVPVLNSGVDGLGKLFEKYPEFICHSISEYKDKVVDILDGKLDLKSKCPVIIEKYVDMENYIAKINKVYGE